MGGGTERPVKLSSWALWDSMGRPKFVCAPMVEQSVSDSSYLTLSVGMWQTSSLLAHLSQYEVK